MTKRTGILITALALALSIITTPVLAAEFAAKLEQDNGQEVTRGSILVSGVKFRMNILSQMGLVTTISRPDLDLVWIINIGDQSYIEIKGVRLGPVAGQAAAKELEKVADKKELGVEKVGNYDCRIVEYTYKDKKLGKVTQWVAKELNYPIKTVAESAKGKVTSLFKDIKVTDVDPVMFEVPKNFHKLEVPQKQKTN